MYQQGKQLSSSRLRGSWRDMEFINKRSAISYGVETELSGVKLKIARFSWWFILIVYGTFYAFSLWGEFVFAQQRDTGGLINLWLFRTISFFSITLACFLFYKKPKNWMAILTSLMLISDLGKYSSRNFFYFIFNSEFYDPKNYNQNVVASVNYATLPFIFIAFSLIYATYLLFPSGKWIFQRAWWLLIAWGIAFVCELFFSPFGASYMASSSTLFSIGFFLVLVGILQLRHYYKMQNSTQRQQVKWVLIFWSGVALENLAAFSLTIWFVLNRTQENLEMYQQLMLILSAVNAVFYFGFLASFGISIFRFRLWDVEIFVNRAVMYSVLTGLLGILGATSLAVINYFIGQWFGENSSVWAVIISVLPVAAAFNPLRDRVQEVVDRYFKPEEVNFENHFLEFRADIRDMLSTSRMIEVVSRQIKKQLNVEFARIYFADENDNIPSLAVSDDILKMLVNGELVAREDNADYSLIVPLVVTRPVFPDFIGVIVLGRRLNGRGYSTPMLESLKILGTNAGEAIYLSQLNEQAKIKVTTSQIMNNG
jgi:hypothetical protein